MGSHGLSDQHVCRLLGLSRTPVFGRIAVVERITSRDDVDAAQLERREARSPGCLGRLCSVDVTERAAVRPTASATIEQEQKVTRGHRSHRPRWWAITAASPRLASQLCECGRRSPARAGRQVLGRGGSRTAACAPRSWSCPTMAGVNFSHPLNRPWCPWTHALIPGLQLGR